MQAHSDEPISMSKLAESLGVSLRSLQMAFAEVYGKLADDKKIPLVPFFLDGVGGHPDLMQADGLHPAAGAQGKLLENVWPTLKPLL